MVQMETPARRAKPENTKKTLARLLAVHALILQHLLLKAMI